MKWQMGIRRRDYARATFLFSTLVISIQLFAQKNISRLAYAITGDTKGSSSWNMVRVIDLSTGEEKRLLLNGATPGLPIYDASNGRQLSSSELANLPSAKFSSSVMGAGVAASAFDKKHNRLYFTPLHIDQLRYIDLNSSVPKVYYVMGQHFNPEGNMAKEENMFTRMVIGADGNGYALTNDGNHLVKFTTSKQVAVTDMGALTDDDKNGGVSIHNKCTSWGGDIISDAFNNFYLFTNSNNAFKIDTRTMRATWLGVISGIPSGFTTNGAAVLDDGTLVISSAYSTEGYYSLDISSLKATKISSSDKVFNTSDLATGNLAFDKLSYENTQPILANTSINKKISIYPNPVSEGNFRVSFDNNPTGEYHIQLMDYLGHELQYKKVNVSFENQVEQINLTRSMAKGVYLVKVIDANKKTVFADKIIVE